MSVSASKSGNVKLSIDNLVQSYQAYSNNVSSVKTANKNLENSFKTLSEQTQLIAQHFKTISSALSRYQKFMTEGLKSLPSSDIEKINKVIDETRVASLNQSVTNLTQTFKEYGKQVKKNLEPQKQQASLWDKIADKITKLFTAESIISYGEKAISSMVKEVEALDKSLTELQKVLDFGSGELDDYVNKAYKLGEAVAKTGNDVIDATVQFAKSGFDKNDSLALSQIALLYQNIADEEISASNAAEFIVAQMKAFNIEAKDSIHIIDAINEVSNNFAVSSTDIANNLGKSSSVLAQSGTTYEQTIGLLTGGTEIIRNASKVSTGLKTISLRLQGMNDEGEQTLELTAKMEKLFNKLGVTTYDSSGKIKSTYELLATLAPIYQQADEATKSFLTESIAGKAQANVAASILSNWETVTKASDAALTSMGSATEENNKYLNSIEGHLNKLKSAWEKFSKNLVQSTFIKLVYDIGTIVLTALNSLIGRVGIASTAIYGLTKVIQSLWGTISTMLSGLSAVKVSGMASLLSNPAGWAAIAFAAIYLIIKAIDYLRKSGERAKQAYEDATKAFEDNENNIKKYKEQIEELESSIASLNNKSNLTYADSQRLTDLERQKSALEAQLIILEAQTEELRKQQQYKAQDNYEKNYSSSSNYDYLDEIKRYREWSNVKKEYDNLLAIMNNGTASQEQVQRIQELRNQFSEFIQLSDQSAQNYQDNISKLSADVNSLLKIIPNLEGIDPTFYQEALKHLYDLLSVQVGESKATSVVASYAGFGDNNNSREIIDAIKDGDYSDLNDMSDSAKNLMETLASLGLGFNDLITLFDSFATSSENVKYNLDDANDVLKQYSSNVDKIKSKYEILTTAVEEYNTTGALTEETFQKLVDGDLLQYLDRQNGKLVANKDALQALAEQERYNSWVTLQNALMKDLNAVATGDMTGASELAKNAIENIGKTAETSGSKLNSLTKDMLSLKAANDLISGQTDTNIQSRMQAVYNAYSKYFDLLRKPIRLSSTKKTSGSSSSSKAWWEVALEDLKNQYNNNEITMDEYIAALEKLLGKAKEGTEAYKEINKVLQEQKLTDLDKDYKSGAIGLSEYIDKLKELLAVYKEGTKGWEDLADKIKSALEKQAKAQQTNLNNAEKAAEQLIDDEIDSLKDLKSEQEKYYDNLIEQKKKANDETEKELELAQLQEALANAKSQRTKKVWREGLGWVWETDQSAIDEAQKALNDFYIEQEQDALEKQKEEALNAIEEQISGWEKYKESWQDVADDYEKQQQRIILAETLGAEAENEILKQRIEAIEKYKKAYLEIIGAIDYIDNHGNADVTKASVGGTLPGYSNGGIVDYTGLAMLHGSSTSPEMVLNSNQISNLWRMLSMPKAELAFANASGGTSNTYNFGNIELPNVTNANQFIKEVKSLINITKNQ